MNKEKTSLQSTFKSQDTEEWMDIHFTRPVGFLWARFFNRFNVHPNVVTILSLFLGVGAGIMFYYPDLLHNVIGVVLLMWANFYDSCDGQLARMTGKKTQWGRMLDGFAGDVWFFTIYLCISLRLFHEPIPFTSMEWNYWIFAVCAFSGIYCHARQCRLADYYRNIHLYFLPGVSSELDTSERQREIYRNTPRKGNFWWRAFLRSYVGYTAAQERMTPQFQRLMTLIRDRRGGKVSDSFRADFRKESLPLMKYANIITFNCRALTLYAACLVNQPWIYPVVEIFVFTALSFYLQHRHETMCRRFYEKLERGEYND